MVVAIRVRSLKPDNELISQKLFMVSVSRVTMGDGIHVLMEFEGFTCTRVEINVRIDDLSVHRHTHIQMDRHTAGNTKTKWVPLSHTLQVASTRISSVQGVNFV